MNLIFGSQPANADKNSAIYEPSANCRTTDTFELKVQESHSRFRLRQIVIDPLFKHDSGKSGDLPFATAEGQLENYRSRSRLRFAGRCHLCETWRR